MDAELIDAMGTDLTVVNTARVSFNKQSTSLSNKDIKLIKYLAKHNHWTPFAHVQVQFRIKAPIFVARQLVKHQVGLVWNEVSRRYVDTDPEFYTPKVWRSRPEGSIKQGSGARLSDTPARAAVGAFGYALHVISEVYKDLLAEGVAPEQARMILPQSMYTEWVWTGSLVSFARIVKQRLHEGAQEETKEIALMIKKELDNVECLAHSWCALLNDN
jgi:thymidylate synthase (FAD)